MRDEGAKLHRRIQKAHHSKAMRAGRAERSGVGPRDWGEQLNAQPLEKHQILDAATAQTQERTMSDSQSPTVTPIRPRDRSANEKSLVTFERNHATDPFFFKVCLNS